MTAMWIFIPRRTGVILLHYDFGTNTDLKRDLRKRHITYAALAEAMFYSVASVKYWLSHPLPAEVEMKIRQAITDIVKEREDENNGKTVIKKL